MSETEALTSVLQELIRQPSVVGFEHSFFRYLHRQGYVDQNPARLVCTPKQPRRQPRPPARDRPMRP